MKLTAQRILIVEDETDIRRIYSELLTRFGYEVDTAEDGEAGWQVLHAARCAFDSHDLLITDNNMPKLSGLELIRKVRSAHLSLPVILASGTEPTNIEALQLAAVLPKPFSLVQLAQTVKDVLHSANGVNPNWRRATKLT